ncbi:hypothetical protein QR98_0027650 [Sarcoptes scabiei]|uniref:Uncharacterized protein n=1 Tax=Sarcoptes scabiei TaxID=52283 RepID=A0A131ZZM5_SARSC|nr:hypothetical protein QR98_0027650 [Sarcoptes scabiei]
MNLHFETYRRKKNGNDYQNFGRKIFTDLNAKKIPIQKLKSFARKSVDVREIMFLNKEFY